MRWEYLLYKTEPTSWLHDSVHEQSIEQVLNNLGQQGWEVASTVETNVAEGRTKDIVFILKRPIPEVPAAE
ncbi:MAG TPA: DUF4177 domain-containing protein [Prosthecobacter sp.]|nr:DUF4177 domain-containing protein [Prosthecobacter sp.]